MIEVPKLYTLQEVADILRISRQTLYNYIHDGKINPAKCGKEYRVTEEELENIIKNGIRKK